MVKMIADKEFPYRGVGLRRGEEFDCEPAHVSVFEMVGQAHRKSNDEQRSPQNYNTRVMTPDLPRGSRARRISKTQPSE